MSVEIPIFFACLLCSAFFSGSETGLLSANRLRLRRMAVDGDEQADRILRLLQDPRRLLAGILVGNNIVNALAVSAATVYCVGYLGDAKGAFVATVVSTVMLVLFSEFLPKTLAAVRPIRFARVVERPIRGALVALWPLVWPLEAVSRPIGRLVRHSADGFGIAELRIAVGEGVRSGAVDATMARVLHGGLSLEWKAAGDILVPRVDVVAVDADADHDTCVRAFRTEHFSRLLVMDGTPDHDLGYLAVKDMTLLDSEARKGWRARDGARASLRVPASMPLPRLLARMRHSGTHFAVVKDEYGGTEGIVTLEDVLEELVGEIRDEHDADEVPPVRQTGEKTWVVRGDVSVKEVERRVGIALAEEKSRTMGGYTAEALGRIAEAGDRIELEHATIEVVKVEDNRVLQVRVCVKG